MLTACLFLRQLREHLIFKAFANTFLPVEVATHSVTVVYVTYSYGCIFYCIVIY